MEFRENSIFAEEFKSAFCKAIRTGKKSLHDWYKKPADSKIRAYENLLDLYFDAKATAVTYADRRSFTFMALYPAALYVHFLNCSYKIALNDGEFERLRGV